MGFAFLPTQRRQHQNGAHSYLEQSLQELEQSLQEEQSLHFWAWATRKNIEGKTQRRKRNLRAPPRLRAR